MVTRKGKVLRFRVKKSIGVMMRALPLLLLHLLLPLMFGMVNGRMKLKDGQLKVRLGPSMSRTPLIALHPMSVTNLMM